MVKKVKFLYKDEMIMKCPACKSVINFHRNVPHFRLNDGKVKYVTIPGMWIPWSKCRNPLCEWSGAE